MLGFQQEHSLVPGLEPDHCGHKVPVLDDGMVLVRHQGWELVLVHFESVSTFPVDEGSTIDATMVEAGEAREEVLQLVGEVHARSGIAGW